MDGPTKRTSVWLAKDRDLSRRNLSFMCQGSVILLYFQQSQRAHMGRIRVLIMQIRDRTWKGHWALWRNLASWDFEDPIFTIVHDEIWSIIGKAGNKRFIAVDQIISAISQPKLDVLFHCDQALSLGPDPNQPSESLPWTPNDSPLDHYLHPAS